MHFALMSPPPGRRPSNTPKKKYVYERANVVALGSGTLYILHPHDDEDFIHTAWFEATVRAKAESACRVAFVFRWLSKRHRFYASGKKLGALVETPELAAARVKRERDKARKRRRGW